MSMSILEKLTAIPREIVIGLVIIAMIIPTLNPLGLPIMTGQMAKDWYNYVEDVPEGSVVLFDIGFGSGGYPSLGPATIAVFHQFFDNNLKVIIMATALEGSMMYPLIMDEVRPETRHGAVYGEDYVFLGYIAGGQTAMAGVLGDLPAIVSNDYTGTPIGQIDVLDGIGGAQDMDLVAYLTTAGGTSEGWVYQGYSAYGMDVLGGFLSMMTTSMKPYYDTGQLLGVIDGVKGAADMEFLTNHPGDAIQSSDVLSFSQTLVVIFIIIGNISYWGSRSARKGEV
jgi:hypothetical protein